MTYKESNFTPEMLSSILDDIISSAKPPKPNEIRFLVGSKQTFDMFVKFGVPAEHIKYLPKFE